MKKTIQISFYSLLLLALVTASSCKKTETIQTQTVSHSLSSTDVCLYQPNGAYTETNSFDINLSDIIDGFNTHGIAYEPSKVTTAKLVSLKAGVVGGSLNNIATIKVFIGIGSGGSLIAQGSGFSGGANNVNLTLTDTELKQFLSNNSTVTLEVTSNTGTYDCVTISGGVINVTIQK